MTAAVKFFLFGLVGLAVGLPTRSEELAPGIVFEAGPVNRVGITRNGKALAIYGCPCLRTSNVEKVFVTHARRDVVWAVGEASKAGVEIVAPASETNLIVTPHLVWQNQLDARFHDYSQQSTRLPTEPIERVSGVKDGDVFRWHDCNIRVISTPGYTRGAVSYIIEAGGKRLAFTGDLFRDDGKLQDLFSFQDAIPEAGIGGYHGWAARLGDLVTSLAKLASEKPDLIIPARGPVIRKPSEVIDRTLHRVRLAYSNYLSIDALRWYFKDEHILAKARRVLGPGATIDWLPMAETRQLPTWVIAISNARLVVAADGSGFLIDCGSREILARLTEMKNEKKLVAVEDVFVTHYHDDHTELLPVLVGEFGARIHACGSLVNVLEHPGDYRLPCLTRNAVSVTARHRPGQSWRWKEFKMTIYDFPGQTVHHNALLVQRDNGEAILFVGDSFTPSGIDDYCLQNRNILRNGEGYLYCLGLVERLPSGCWLVNQHVEPAFRFTREQLRRMRQTLETRKSILAELLPYDDPNFGLDEGWCTFYPYATEVRAGDSAQISVRITNHSPCIQSFEITIHGPEGWVHGDTRVLTLPPATEGAVFVTLSVPSDTTPGLRVITADVSWGNHDLRHWAECLVEVKP